MMKFELYQDNSNKWRWRIRSTNGRIIGAATQGYARINVARLNAHLIMKALTKEFSV